MSQSTFGSPHDCFSFTMTTCSESVTICGIVSDSMIRDVQEDLAVDQSTVVAGFLTSTSSQGGGEQQLRWRVVALRYRLNKTVQVVSDRDEHKHQTTDPHISGIYLSLIISPVPTPSSHLLVFFTVCQCDEAAAGKGASGGISLVLTLPCPHCKQIILAASNCLPFSEDRCSRR